MDKRKREPSELKSLLGGSRLPRSVKDHVKGHRIWTQWQEIVGPELYRVTAPLEIRSKVLLVQVAHQAWAQQLHFLKPSLMSKIRSFCDETELKDLQFRVGEVKHIAPVKRELASEFKVPEKKVSLSERQEMTLRAVEDPDLRIVIRRAMEAEARRH